MHVSNEQDFGHLVNPDNFDLSRKHPDIYQVMDNKIEWEDRYLSPEYAENYAEGRKHSMVCIFLFNDDLNYLVGICSEAAR